VETSLNTTRQKRENIYGVLSTVQ